VKYVIGLGNPGRQYSRTRHNIGWRVLDELAASGGIEQARERWGGLVARRDELTLFKPLTFMNESGRAVAGLVEGTGAGLQDLLVLLDDLNLSFGVVRLRARGSAGGHKGLQSIIDGLGTEEFPRLRLGIGGGRADLSAREFVLSEFDAEELPLAEQMVRWSARAVRAWAREGVERAMSRYNADVRDVESDGEGRKSWN
jgi:PTH1 family peptidyl-tRNA hydrolase